MLISIYAPIFLLLYIHTGRGYLLTQAGIFLALTFPGFFLSTLLISRVTQPAVVNYISTNFDSGKGEEQKTSRDVLNRTGWDILPLRSAGFNAGSWPSSAFDTAKVKASAWPVVPPPLTRAHTLYLSILSVAFKGQIALSRS